MAAPFSAPRTCPVLIGRDAMLRSLTELLAQARDGSGGIALLSGEAGIGKSRLVAQLQADSRANPIAHAPTILQGNCFEPDRTLPYAPLLDLLDTFIGSLPPADIPAALGTAATELAKLIPTLAPLIPDFAPAPALDPEQEKRRLFQALAQFFLHLADASPLLVIIEDIHWCDDTSLEFFLSLARRIVHAPIVVVFTYRSDEVHPDLAHFLAMLDRERLATEYALTRLTPPQVEAMLRAIFGPVVGVRWDFAATIYTLTEGNPFFIEEIAKSVTLSERGEPPALVATSPNDILPPRSVQDAVRRRSAQLSTDAQGLLRIAAVAGRRFDFMLLQALTGQDELALLETIKELIAAQLVVEESADRFAFRHALTQQAVYADLLARERQLFHQTIAETIERIHADAPEAHLADLAHHYYAAGAWRPAFVYTRQVGERAAALHAPRAAAEHFTHAIEAARELEAAPPGELYRARGLVYGILGDFEHARDDHELALHIARAAADRRAEWRSLMDLGDLWAGHDYGRAGAFFRDAAALAHDLDDPSVHARSLNRLANWLINTGEPDESLRVHEEALRIFSDTNDRQGMAETFDLLGMANGIAGATVDGVRHYERAIALLRDGGETKLLSSSLASKAIYASPSLSDVTYCPGGDPDVGTSELEEALRLARQSGWLAGEAYAHWTAAATLASYGRLGSALQHGMEALRIAQEIEHPQWTTAAQWSLGHTYNDLLMADRAIEHLEAGLSLAHAVGSAWWLAHLSASLAATHLLHNDPTQAASVLSLILPADGQPRIMPERRVAWMWGGIALAERDPATALRIADTLIGSAPGAANGEAIPWLAKLRGEALTALSRFDEAALALDAAARAATLQKARPILWQVQRARGHLFRRWKRAEAAEHAYGEARATVATLAATLDDPTLHDRFLTAALATMPRERQPSPRQADTARYDGLTPREREIATHIARGESNRAIADALFLSERTVTTHVTSILGKLGLTSRAQVAAWAVAHGLAHPDE